MVAQLGRALKKQILIGILTALYVRDTVVIGSNPVHRFPSMIWDTRSNLKIISHDSEVLFREWCPEGKKRDPHSNVFQVAKSKCGKFVIRFESGNKRAMNQ